jgi:WD40 repeat protein
MRYECKSEEASLVVDGHDGSIWGLATHPQKNFFVTGGYDNAIKLWDADTRKCIDTFEFELEEGDKKGYQVSCAAWSNAGDLIAVGTEQSKIAIFKSEPLTLLTLHEIPPKTQGGAVEAVSYLRFSPDGNLLAAAHMDSNMYIFSVSPAPEGVLLERWPPLPHVAAPTNVQFSGDGTMVKSLTRDYEVCHWRLDADKQRAKFEPSIPLPEDLEWGDDPLIAGWDVEGLYQQGWDGTDLNDATVTSDRTLIVSGDDYGTVRLHNYPAIAPEACKAYTGHAEFVVGVEFLRDDSQLITCGGDDMAIMQWRLNRA